MKGLLTALAWILGIAGFALLAFQFERFTRATAQHSEGPAAAWIYTPHVTPGGTLHGEVKVYGGIRAGIHEVVVRGGAETVSEKGRGQHWGYSITSKSSDSGEDGVDFAVTVPPDAEPGRPLTLDVQVRYVMALRSTGSFFNSSDRAAFQLQVTPTTTTGRLMGGLLASGRALLSLALLVWLYLRWWPSINRLDRSGKLGQDASEGLGYLMLCVAMFIAMGGYPLFAQPLMAATGLASDWFAALAVVFWIVGAPFIAWRIHKRRPKTTTFQARFADAGRGTPLEALIPALRQATHADPRRRGRALLARRDRQRWVRVAATDPRRVEAGLTLEALDHRQILDCAPAIAAAVAPFVLVGPLVELSVDSTSTPEALDAAHADQVLRAAQAMMERLEAMRLVVPR